MKEIVLQILMWIVTGCLYVSYLPQIVKILRTKKAEDLSKASWVLWSISSIADFYLLYIIRKGRTYNSKWF